MAIRIAFLGAATTVTGSQFLVSTGRARVLVDCGMFQGGPHEVERNRVPLAYDTGEIDAIVLTHAHLDHCGLLPQVAALGYRGPVYATRATAELAALVLRDSAKLQEEFAHRAERRRRHDPAHDVEASIRAHPPEVVTEPDEPLYRMEDAERAIALFRGVGYDTPFELAPGVRATLHDAGHILGSAIVRLAVDDAGGTRTIVFSGDLGRPNTPIIRDPTVVTGADYVIVESTYGGREHEPREEAARHLADAVQTVAERAGVLLVPSFAIGRTQELVWELERLIEAGRVARLPLFLDSPMASKASDVYRRHPECYDDETRALLAEHHAPLDYPGAVTTNDADASRAIARAPRPHLVVASNGMLTGGRVLAHFRELVDDPSALLLFVGYQGQGTLGAHLLAGEQSVVIDGQRREVRLAVRAIDGFSAHADEPELLAWLAHFTAGKRAGEPGYPKRVFVVHGDPEAQRALEPKVRALTLDTHVPRWRETVELD